MMAANSSPTSPSSPSLVLRFPIARPSSGAMLPGIGEYIQSTYETIYMKLQYWWFPDSSERAIAIKGVEILRYVPGCCKELDGVDSPRGYIVVGYRCQTCRKVFFAADEQGYVHECMEGAK